VVPLVYFTSQKRKMGEFVNGRALAAVAWAVAATIMGLNTWLLIGTFKAWIA
jgi:manganese transport protein